jgi:hypothetical protein
MFDDDVGLLEASVGVAHREVEPLDHVRRLVGAFDALGAHVLVQDRRRRLHRLDRIDHVRKNFVLDFDQLERSLCNRLARRRHCRDRMAVIERLLARHGVSGHVAVRRARLDLREVGARHHRLDAGEFLGRRDVDRPDARMRMRAAQNLSDQHAGQVEVGAELGAPRHLVNAVMLDRGGADDLELLVRVEAALLQDSRHDQAPLISFAAACTERMILS